MLATLLCSATLLGGGVAVWGESCLEKYNESSYYIHDHNNNDIHTI